MRISELAALVGVSTRAIRHYHHRGLLPEPDRLTNGYREYGLRDAVTLARVRRLAELGLSLDEIRDVLADDQGRELREVLQELDLDLARAQEDIGARRAELARLLAESDLHLDSTVSPELAAVLRGIPAGTSKIAELDRQLLTVLDSLPAPAQVADLLRSFGEPDAVEQWHALYARLDELVDADPRDTRVATLAGELAARLPDELAAAMVDGCASPEASRWLAEMTKELSPAQAEVFRLMLLTVRERR
jgi:DNA-binding transcriptional MerR regulator